MICYIKAAQKRKRRENQHNMFSILTRKSLYLTDQPYKNNQTKTIKNGRNIIKNVPCDSEGNIDTETIAILEWIYKQMYIKNKKQVDFNQMKKSYEKEQLSLKEEMSSKLFIL